MKAIDFIKILEEMPIGYIPIDVEDIGDPEQELLNWIDAFLRKTEK